MAKSLIAACLLQFLATAQYDCNAAPAQKAAVPLPVQGCFISPRFEDANLFFEGLAAVEEDGKRGFIGNDGAFVTDQRSLRSLFDRFFSA
jgi:hypothetical protein